MQKVYMTSVEVWKSTCRTDLSNFTEGTKQASLMNPMSWEYLSAERELIEKYQIRVPLSCFSQNRCLWTPGG